jgi:thiol-disulfide isomerase/thioredoxin
MIKASQDPTVLQGKDAPAIVLNDLSGNAFDLSKVKTRIVVLDFWATWCGPCRRAMPEMIELNKWVNDNKLDVSVYTVNQQEDKNHVKQFVTEQGWTLPVLLDANGKTSASYRAFSIPQSVIIVDGKVKRIFTGYAPRFAEEWRNVIREVLDIKP